MLLEIHIPETWTAASPQAGGEFSWQLREGSGRLARSGRAALNALPRAEHCRIVLPAGRVTLASVRPPSHNRRKFMQALPFAVEDRIMADPETVHVAAGPLLENGEMPVAIVERAWLRALLEALRGAGVNPAQADVETLLAPWRENTWSLVWRGQCGFLRQSAHGGLALDGGGGCEPPPGLALAVAEAGVKPESILLYADQAEMPDGERWSSLLGVPVNPAGAWDRSAQGAGGGINLLQGEFAPAGPMRDWLPRLRPALFLLGVMAALQLAFSIADWTMLRYEKNRLTAGMEQNFRAAFPNAKVIVDATLQMGRNLAGLRHAAGQVDRNDFLPLMASVAPLLGSEARLQHLEYQQGALKMNLTLANSAALDALKTRLHAVSGARLEAGKTMPSGLDATLTLGMRP